MDHGDIANDVQEAQIESLANRQMDTGLTIEVDGHRLQFVEQTADLHERGLRRNASEGVGVSQLAVTEFHGRDYPVLGITDSHQVVTNQAMQLLQLVFDGSLRLLTKVAVLADLMQ